VKVRIEHNDGKHSIQFEPYVYVASYHTTAIIMDDKEYADYRDEAIRNLVYTEPERVREVLRAFDGEEAAATGDANTPFDDEDCPICGGPLPCVKCLADLRCDS
jgi:hypothetical protein